MATLTLFEGGARRGTVRYQDGAIVQTPALPLSVLRALVVAFESGQRHFAVAGRHFHWIIID